MDSTNSTLPTTFLLNKYLFIMPVVSVKLSRIRTYFLILRRLYAVLVSVQLNILDTIIL